MSVVDTPLDSVEAGVEECRDPSVRSVKGNHDDKGIGLSLTIGCTVVVLARLEDAGRLVERFKFFSRLHACWGGPPIGRLAFLCIEQKGFKSELGVDQLTSQHGPLADYRSRSDDHDWGTRSPMSPIIRHI